jgi:hypothetical protein
MCGSAMTLSLPHFNMLENKTTFPHQNEHPSSLGSDMLRTEAEHGFGVLADTRIFREGMYSIFRDLQKLTMILDSFHHSRPSRSMMLEFSNQSSSVEYQLVSMTASDGMTKLAGNLRHVQEACRLAGVLYVNRVLRAMPPNAASVIKMVQHLRNALERGDCDQVPQEISRLLLWELYTGAGSSIGSEEREWFVSRLVVLSKKLALKSWFETKSILSKYLWLERIFESVHSIIYDEVQGRIT